MRRFLILLTFLVGCDQAQEEAKGKPIARQSSDHLVNLEIPPHRVRDSYPWEERYLGVHSKITKEFFRCRGSSCNPIDTAKNSRGQQICLADCGGADQHSLPVVEEREFVYPVLIELLNYLQEKLDKRVVITCGHRCPAHNSYADRSGRATKSKHLIAAEVDFYVQGMENQPWKIVELLMAYYKGQDPDYSHFVRYNGGDIGASTPPWYNKEILIKLYGKNEGRDYDNHHPHPYISLEVRYDREKKTRVHYSWQKAYNGYMRW